METLTTTNLETKTIGQETKLLKQAFDFWIGSSKSENTKRTYESTLQQFCQLMFKKNYFETTHEDWETLTYDTIQDCYIGEMSRSNYKQSSIMSKLRTLQSFVAQLKRSNVFPDLNLEEISKNVLSPKALDDDSESTPNMTKNDKEAFRKWLISERFPAGTRNGKRAIQYALLVDFMWATAARVSASFKLKFSDFKYEEDSYGQFGWNVYVVDKGAKTNMKSISDDLYNRLVNTLGRKDSQGHLIEDDVIFRDLSQTGFSNLLSEFSEIHGKKLTPHSIKAGAITHLYTLTKDSVLVQRFADHEDFNTTLRYIGKIENRILTGSHLLSQQSVGMKELEQLSKEELLNIIKGRTEVMEIMNYELGRKQYLDSGVYDAMYNQNANDNNTQNRQSNLHLSSEQVSLEYEDDCVNL